MRKPVAAAMALAVTATFLVGCTAVRDQAQPTIPPSPLMSACAAQHRLRPHHGFPELHGVGTASLYGLVMPTHIPVRVGDQLKIVWRMTGRGPAHFWATGPSGRRAPLLWGPDLHLGSSYHRPGTEWGTGYRFAAPGCWQLHARRSVGQASAALWVAHRR
jgi:hypothetical protein